MSLSTKGITRRYLGVTAPFSVRAQLKDASSETLSMRTQLELLATQPYRREVSECVFAWTAAFQQIWSTIRVRIQLNPDAGISAATMATVRQTWRTGIESTWSNRWALGRSGEAACPLDFEVQWVTTDPHHTVRVRAGSGATNKGTWYTADSGAVAAHEFGHMLGHPDEYPSATCPGRSPVSTGTVMDNNSTTVPRRLMTPIANLVDSNVVAIPS